MPGETGADLLELACNLRGIERRRLIASVPGPHRRAQIPQAFIYFHFLAQSPSHLPSGAIHCCLQRNALTRRSKDEQISCRSGSRGDDQPFSARIGVLDPTEFDGLRIGL